MTSVPSRARVPALWLVSLIMVVPHLVRERAVVGAAWPVWRPLLLDLLLIVAGAVLVAGAAFGVHAWRAGQRHA